MAIPKECKRLAEVDFPIAVVSKHSAREKYVRQGHPTTLHLWWARRPLAACRAILLGLLLPDPCDPYCPDDFKKESLKLLRRDSSTSDKTLQKALLKFIGDFANWDAAADRKYLEIGRGLIKAAHPEEKPLVVDPFTGGGSIPLEALRLGCDAFASDLNPVAGLVQKVLLEDIPRHGQKLAEELRNAGEEIQKAAEKELEEYYPIDTDGSRPIVYLWARTVNCESPNCGAEIPLIRSFWLSKKINRRSALKYEIVRQKGKLPRVDFYIFEPRKDKDVPTATITQAKATCLCCGAVLSPDRVRVQLTTVRGGADVSFDKQGNRIGGARILAVVILKENEPGRHYRLPTDKDYEPVWKAKKSLDRLSREAQKGDQYLSIVPDEIISLNEIRRISVPIYGATTWGDIFTSRQKRSLSTYAGLVRKSNDKATAAMLALAVDRMIMLMSAHCRWKPTGETLIDMFGRHAIGMVWDFAEAVPGVQTSSIFKGWIDAFAQFAEDLSRLSLQPAQVISADACKHPLPDASCDIWFTDPPYYDSIPYAHLSDCFYVWLKRMLSNSPLLPAFSTELTPKEAECVVDRPHRLSTSNKDAKYFEEGIKAASAEGRRILADHGIGCIVFAHKTTEGWESLLSGIIQAGWAVTASWPISTELATRLNARDTASLDASIHLICRPRINDQVGDWGEVLRELPKRVGDWIERLQAEHVRGADLVFACIGPALEIFSRYSRVETAEGKEIPLAEYLAKVWEVVGRTALEHVLGTAEAKARNGMAGALEEDARLTALFLWTLQSTNIDESYESESDEERADEDEDESEAKGKKSGYNMIYDVARRFAQPLGIHLEKWEGRIVETSKGVVRLLSVHERAKQLFGEEGVQAVAEQMKYKRAESLQMTLFAHAELPSADEQSKPSGKKKTKIEISEDAAEARKIDATTLDRVHAAMLLQAGGQSNALRVLLKAEQERGQDFLRLSNALSALYPRESEEKRLLDAMLLAVPR